MTLKEFKFLVALIPEEYDLCPVILQRDPEGNSFGLVDGIDTNSACKVDGHYVDDVINLSMTPANNGKSKKEQSDMKKNNRCVIIWPL